MKCRLCGANAYREVFLLSSGDCLKLCISCSDEYKQEVTAAPRPPCNCHQVKAETEFLRRKTSIPSPEGRKDPGPRKAL